MKKNKKKRIVLIMPYYDDLSTYPAIIQGIKILHKKYNFSIVTTNKCESQDIKGNFCNFIQLKYFKVRNICTLSINSLYFLGYILKLHPDYIVCFTSDGVEAAFFSVLYYSIFGKVRFVYYNLEILTDAEYKGKVAKYIYKIRKMIERWFTNKSYAFIIQDEIRKSISSKYGINHDNTYFLPNTYVYNEYSVPLCNRKCNKRVLYVGALSEWSVGDLFADLEQLNNVDITFAGWDRDGFILKYENELRKHPNVKVVLQQLSEKEYDCFVQQYDIGLIYYSSADENVRNIGLSSGKFFKFLSLGKPVIVKNLPGMAEEVNKFKLGKVIEKANEIEGAVESIVNGCDNWSKHISEIYIQHYDYANLLNQIVERIEIQGD